MSAEEAMNILRTASEGSRFQRLNNDSRRGGALAGALGVAENQQSRKRGGGYQEGAPFNVIDRWLEEKKNPAPAQDDIYIQYAKNAGIDYVPGDEVTLGLIKNRYESEQREKLGVPSEKGSFTNTDRRNLYRERTRLFNFKEGGLDSTSSADAYYQKTYDPSTGQRLPNAEINPTLEQVLKYINGESTRGGESEPYNIGAEAPVSAPASPSATPPPDMLAANDAAKTAGQDTFTFGGKKYRVK